MSWIDPTRSRPCGRPGRRFARIRVVSDKRAKSWTFQRPGALRRFHSERSLLSAPSAPDYGDVPTPAPKWTQTLVATLALVGATAVWGSTFLVTKQSCPRCLRRRSWSGASGWLPSRS
jgi:hypothetical protein